MPMCLACGQLLKSTDAKCPSCGAPVPGRAPKKSSTLRIGALIFAIITLYVGSQGILIVIEASQGDFNAPADTLGDGDLQILGSVTDRNGLGLVGVNVTLKGADANGTRTGENGTYTLKDLPAGYYIVRFQLDGYKSTEVRMFLLLQDESANVKLEPGDANETMTVEHSTFTNTVRTLNICGSVLVAVGLLQLAGAVACYRRRSYKLALTAAIVGAVVSVPLIAAILLGQFAFLPVVVLAVIALVLVVKNKRDFF